MSIAFLPYCYFEHLANTANQYILLQFGTVNSNCRWSCYYVLCLETGCRSALTK